jgi:hypothetical protein
MPRGAGAECKPDEPLVALPANRAEAQRHSPGFRCQKASRFCSKAHLTASHFTPAPPGVARLSCCAATPPRRVRARNRSTRRTSTRANCDPTISLRAAPSGCGSRTRARWRRAPCTFLVCDCPQSTTVTCTSVSVRQRVRRFAAQTKRPVPTGCASTRCTLRIDHARTRSCRHRRSPASRRQGEGRTARAKRWAACCFSTRRTISIRRTTPTAARFSPRSCRWPRTTATR